MTRINIIHPRHLFDGHLIAEFKELPRIFYVVRVAQAKGRKAIDYSEFDHYVLGEGHMKFFYTRLAYLEKRYGAICKEMNKRGLSTSKLDLPSWISFLNREWFGDYVPTAEAVKLNVTRINTRLAEMNLSKYFLDIDRVLIYKDGVNRG